MIEKAIPHTPLGNVLEGSIREEDLLSAMETFLAVYREERLKKRPGIPLPALSDPDLGILEATTKYLRENLSMKFSQIAKLLNRDDRTIWVSYKNSIKKHKARFDISENHPSIPCDIFSKRNTGPLQSVVIYLKDELHLSFKEISKILNRHYVNISQSYYNGKRKNEVRKP